MPDSPEEVSGWTPHLAALKAARGRTPCSTHDSPAPLPGPWAQWTAAEPPTTVAASWPGCRAQSSKSGPGPGSSFPLYPPAVTHVLALEPDDYLRAVAETQAATASVPVTVVAAAAENIPAKTGSADAVVASLVLCSVKDQAAVLAEIRRVLRPGGTLAFYEHVRSVHPFLAAAEDVLTPVWGRFMGGCHLNRDTLAAITAAGFTVRDNQRFGFAVQRLNPPLAHILGTATSPGSPG
ncbi:class I SAM-dependent methyltransferase [Arthrobacter sp. SLBN-112]|uniref:class I SAM-dependent methyltransferase n=1 Tax=Arthrobacter sp. SLBN-112 TaxID=2768452 RepID=UPI0027AFD44B|nr:class I SAM-dependent methyltransferase [Arthrobacter sp. SLBN-112]MDQ0802114.1 SAM-dependent methyltransferase [Arthrobacter sp. SLBN-112]